MDAPEGLRLRVLAPPPLIFLSGLLVGALLDRAFPMAAATPRPWAGLPLVALGLALDVWAAWTFRQARTTVLPWGSASALVPTGPYRWSRNPMYVGMTVAYVGVALALGAGWAYVLLPVVLVVLTLGVVRREEAYLEARFGAAYLEYKRRVRRWF